MAVSEVELQAPPAGADAGAPDELCLLLTPREPGGHEATVLGWLADAVRLHGLRLRIAAPTPVLAAACRAAGLGARLWPGLPAPGGQGGMAAALRHVLQGWPQGRPLLLAPGMLHADAWLLAAAVAMGHEVWVHVPMACSAQHMGHRLGTLRDTLLAPWLRRVRLWITGDGQQCRWLHRHWRLPAPVQVLPSLPRLPPQTAPACQRAVDHRLRVAWVGRFDLRPCGLDWLAGLLQTQAHWHQQQRWHFQGQGPGEPALQALASALGPQHALVHPPAPIHQALACNDLLLLPCRPEFSCFAQSC